MKDQSGFTLIELVVATAIFFIMSAMVYAMLDGVRRQLVFSEQNEAELREIHYALRRVALDIAQLQPRPVRDEVGDGWMNAVQAGGGGNAVELSVGGWRNPVQISRGTIQRVAYVIDGDVLTRIHWPVLDRTLSTEPLRTELMTGVQSIQIRFLNEAGEWTEQWPPLEQSSNPRLRPRAIELIIEHESWGVINRVIEIAG